MCGSGSRSDAAGRAFVRVSGSRSDAAGSRVFVWVVSGIPAV